MKATGIVRNIDELGRIVLPMELRRTLDIEVKAPLEIYVDSQYIILKKYNPSCVICGSMEELEDFQGKKICKKCVKEL
ncbi:AbrB/MazE/SpoVT family DNA-binding domain-containing protein [Aminipila sp.]|uniref:AbrB/MazE/SpoVT family DNA-binding domain-containing protein n=1 Tax=Aminipila sp. TaxID=2060095 RepID=UPI00289E0C27|nr:AbrB/MazE/SpoVT family DNA-binding domain-containing protein [Aminipila sp.]